MAVPSNGDPIERQIVRILFILYYCHDDLPQLFPEPDHVHWIDSETKIQKVDFWIRYPDHLAAALLHGLEQGGPRALGARKEQIAVIVRNVVKAGEPRYRWTPMHKYMRGAFESLNEVMVFLISHNLGSYQWLEGGNKVKRYYLSARGVEVVEGLLQECIEASWYAERCQVINSFFGYLNGFELGRLQYMQEIYARTPLWQIVPRVEPEVRARYLALFGEEI